MKILIAGEGGQGVQAIAQILAKAAFLEGKQTLYIPNFGVEQRGGVSLAFLVIQNTEVFYPKFEKADILAILAERSAIRVKRYIDNMTQVIHGPALKNGNIFVLGKINRIGNIVRSESLIQSMEERFVKQFQKDPNLKKLDLEALKG